MNYEYVSDFEINKSVACHLGVFWHVKPCNSETGGWLYSENYEKCDTSIGQVAIELPDYCNNPSDAWPIIDKHNICIHNDEMEGRSYACSFDKHGYVSEESYCDKTLRAAMIVFLMMQEQAK